MNNKTTIGGKRLGSGGTMTVDMQNFGRSSHDQGFVFTTDQAFGTLVPALCQIGTRGYTFYLDNIASIVRTLPTNGPVFGSIKQQIDVFVAPIRLYIGALHNNTLGIGLKMDEVKIPQEKHITTVYAQDLKLKAPNLASVASDSLSAYLGSRASKMGANFKNLPYSEEALFLMFYWDIYKNMYANKQEEEGVVIAPKKQKQTIIANGFIDENGDDELDYNTTTGILENYPYQVRSNAYFRFTKDTANIRNLSLATTGYDGKPYYQKFKELPGWKYFEYADANVWQYISLAGQLSVTIPINVPTIIDETVELTGINLERFPLKNIDKMREDVLAAPIGTPLYVNGPNSMVPYNVGTQTFQDKDGLTRETRALAMCGLGVKTHLSDIFNNWIQTDWIDGDEGINQLTAIDTSDGKFTMDDFIFNSKMFKMMNRIAIQDGSYEAWQTAVYGARGPVITESPVYCGGYSTEIGFDEVVSNAASGSEPLGSLAGRGSQQGQTKKGGKNIKIKCNEASLIMVINSFTPRVTYSQGEAWYKDLKSMDDFHKPDLDAIAFQNLPTKWMLGTTSIIEDDESESVASIGKQPSWIEYTTETNKSFGSFAAGGPLEHMVINRCYEQNEDGTIQNATTYIDPTEFNTIFANEDLSEKPFWVQIGFDVTSRRVMSASQIPNL